MAARIRKGDTVIAVITGSDRGQVAVRFMQVLPEGFDRGDRAGRQCIAKRHTKASGMGSQGGIIEKRGERSIVSNLKLVDPKSDRPTRVGFRDFG